MLTKGVTVNDEVYLVFDSAQKSSKFLRCAYRGNGAAPAEWIILRRIDSATWGHAMDYKTILVHLDESEGTRARTAFAAQLAIAHRAHLVGVSQANIHRYLYEPAFPDIVFTDQAPLLKSLQDEAIERGRQFDVQAQQAGVASYEHRIGYEEPATALALQAMYADLVIVGPALRSGAEARAGAAIADHVALNAPCPVLVLPGHGDAAARPDTVLVAWNASPEAARAVRGALPFLVQAREVQVATFSRRDDELARAALGGDDVALFLARHGATVSVRQQGAADDVGAALLSLASDIGAGLLVMGCYGRSRLREIMLGGVSRTILRGTTLPTLLAH